MPYILSKQTCKKCLQSNKLFRNKWHSTNKKYYLQTTCKECEDKRTKEHQQNNREYWNALNRKAYRNQSDIAKRKRNLRGLVRHKRTKVASRGDELTEFVFEEAYTLCRLREKYTTSKWHIDHILPLNGRLVSGLHVWNNFQVIPARLNLSKGNKEVLQNSIYEERSPGLQTGIPEVSGDGNAEETSSDA